MIMEGRLGSAVCKDILNVRRWVRAASIVWSNRAVFGDRPEFRHPRVPHLLVLALVQITAPNKNLQLPLQSLGLV